MLASYPVWRSADTPFYFHMVSTTDGVSPATGLGSTPTLQVARAGAAPVATSAPITEVGDGWYKATNPSGGTVVAATHLYGSTLPYGPYLLIAAASGARGSGLYEIVATNPATEVERLVWGENVNDMKTAYGEESAAQAFHNAFGWNTGGYPTDDPDTPSPSGVRIASSGLDFVEVEDDVNARQALAAMAAVLAGRSAGLGTSQVTYYAVGASGTTGTSVVRVVAVPSGRNRGTVTLTLPD